MRCRPTEHVPGTVVQSNKQGYRNPVIDRTVADTFAERWPRNPLAEESLEHIEIPD